MDNCCCCGSSKIEEITAKESERKIGGIMQKIRQSKKKTKAY